MQVTCAAPSCNKQALNYNHCTFHSEQFRPLYNQYKRLQESINQYLEHPQLLESLTVIRLLRVLNITNQVAEKRRRYQKEAFAPAFHDEGHKEMISRLFEMSGYITQLLSKLFQVEKLEEIPTSNKGQSLSKLQLDDEPKKKRVKSKTVSLREVIDTFAKEKQLLEEELNRCQEIRETTLAQIRTNLDLTRKRIESILGREIIESEFRLIHCVPYMARMIGGMLEDFDRGAPENISMKECLVDQGLLPSAEEIAEDIYTCRGKSWMDPDAWVEKDVVISCLCAMIERRKDLGPLFIFWFNMDRITKEIYLFMDDFDGELRGTPNGYWPDNHQKEAVRVICVVNKHIPHCRDRSLRIRKYG